MQVVMGETALIYESLSDYEQLRVFLELADERGHAAPSVVVDERGCPVTHPDYVDRMGAPHIKAGAWAFCRRPAAEAFGLPGGTDWVRDHSMSLMFYSGSPYLTKPHLHEQVYIQPFGTTTPAPLRPVSVAQPVAWNNEGSRVCSMEIRMGHVTDGTGMAGYVLWEFEPLTGQRRRIAAFRDTAALGLSELSYSSDDEWIHLCQWGQGRNLLIRVADGLVVTLPIVSRAVGWNPRSGPSAMVMMAPDAGTGRLVIYNYDLATGTRERRSDIESPNGVPLDVRELSMSSDGRTALVTAPVGVPGIGQQARAGVHVAAVLDIDDGSIEPILPVSFQTAAAQRRHTSPRWCEERSKDAAAKVIIADRLMAAATHAACDDDSPELLRDFRQRWSEILQGIETAWNTGRTPPGRFAYEYVQYTLSCYDIDETATEHEISGMRNLARTDQLAKTIVRAIDTYRSRGWRPAGNLALPTDTGPGSEDPTADPRTWSPAGQPPEGAVVAPALDRLIAAGTISEASAAAAGLRSAGHLADVPDGEIWAALAATSMHLLRQKEFVTAAKLGLATVFWNEFYQPGLARSGLSPAPDSARLPILVNAFEACIRLPERTVIGRDSQHTFDAEDTRARCQAAMAKLPLTEHLMSANRRHWPAHQSHAAPDPARESQPSSEEPSLVRKRIFISYVREDATAVDRLASGLRDNGFDVWLDRTHLIAGVKWKSVIRKAIRSGDYFIACFSPAYTRKNETFMNEELIIAIDRLRLMHRSRHWFIPVMLEKCDLPDYPIGPGETLEDLHYLEFFDDWDTAMAGLLSGLAVVS